MLKFIGELTSGENIFLCLSGNSCAPQVVYEKIQAPEHMKKVYLDYLGSDGPWDIENLAERVARQLEDSCLGKIILAGYSAGGVLAQAIAVRIPDKISGLMLSNTGPCTIGQGAPHFAEELQENYNNETYMRKFISSCFYRPIDRETEDRMWEYTRTVKAEAAIQVSASIRELDLREKLKKYHNPVTIVHGKMDQRRKLNAVEMLKDSLPQAKVILVDTGHTPVLEAWSEYQDALNQMAEQVFYD